MFGCFHCLLIGFSLLQCLTRSTHLQATSGPLAFSAGRCSRSGRVPTPSLIPRLQSRPSCWATDCRARLSAPNKCRLVVYTWIADLMAIRQIRADDDVLEHRAARAPDVHGMSAAPEHAGRRGNRPVAATLRIFTTAIERPNFDIGLFAFSKHVRSR